MLSKCRQITVKHLISNVVSSSCFVGMFSCGILFLISFPFLLIQRLNSRWCLALILPTVEIDLSKLSKTFQLPAAIHQVIDSGVAQNHF